MQSHGEGSKGQSHGEGSYGEGSGIPKSRELNEGVMLR